MRLWRIAPLVVVGITCLPAVAAPPGTLYLAAESPGTEGDFEKDWKQANLKVLPRTGEGWTLHFLAFLKKPPGAKQMNLVFYDMAVKKHEAVNAFPITTQPDAKILSSSVNFTSDNGLVAGHKYHVLVTRLVRGKEEIYARSTIKLK